MSLLLHGDCLEHMKDLDDNSIDLIFCDLPYGQTSCKWDCKIDLEKFWIEVMRIKKLNTPIFFTTTTKFGVELINSAPKKCFFRYDIVWVKSAPVGFLSAKKMPMRKHEMVYVFYEKLPYYDLSSHKHKFIKEVPTKRSGKDGVDNVGMIKNRSKSGMEKINKYDPPLPTSIVKEEDKMMGVDANTLYGDVKLNQPANEDGTRNKYRGQFYDPPLPTTMLEIKSTKGKHSTEKPVALMEWILKYYSKPGDTILDPTMGSGSTGVACKNMKRNFIGIEMDDEIYDVAYKRINE